MVDVETITNDNPVIAWWSGGVTSAVACKLCVDWFGVNRVRAVFLGTRNEDDDTYRFQKDCEKWYDLKIETVSSQKYNTIQEVWYDYLSLNVATGAICSTELKRSVREQFQRDNNYSYQAFGFESEEFGRARRLNKNYPESRPIFPLIYELLSKNDCIKIIQTAGIEIPAAYSEGYHNNNCRGTMCVQGGIGYWQKVQKEYPDKFEAMAKVEHDLTDRKGEPVTMLKDQAKGGGLVFLKPHQKYPFVKDISMMKGREPKPLVDCNGFCGTNDLIKNPTEQEINYSSHLLEKQNQ